MKQFGAVTEPLGLAYIAGYLVSKNISVRIIDASAERMSGDDIVQSILNHGERIIGISILTPSFHIVRELCRKIRHAFRSCIIVLGGPHCTALPEQTLQEIPEADITCFGEGEQTMAEIAEKQEDLNFEKIKGICYRSGSKILRTEDRPYIRELDTIPPPARNLLPMKKYHLTASRVEGDSYCPTIIVARGCPFSCTYCSRTFGRTFRAHSVNRIISEIRSLVDLYQISQINIEADTLTVKKKFIKELCNALIDSGVNKRVKWTCESRVDTVNEETLKLMRKAGCWQISYGVETGSQRLLDLINKSVTLEQIEDTFRITKQAGITVRGFFMLGLPTETRAESMATIEFAKKLNPT
ncbi:MAG: radical SAM protein, partial [Desulfobacterales bacterium]|nr:B12-binding domain-containing radical SAM protein [Deltaproteobacteria bacterium]NNL41963.1 radical SAM protein [Desulfobacterales bacterium]